MRVLMAVMCSQAVYGAMAVATGCVGVPDEDSDSICDSVDSCLADLFNDGDNDGVCDAADSCWNDTLNDADSDGTCD